MFTGIDPKKDKRAKLTDLQIEYIRKNPDRMTQQQLAEAFSVSQGYISRVKRFAHRQHKPEMWE